MRLLTFSFATLLFIIKTSSCASDHLYDNGTWEQLAPIAIIARQEHSTVAIGNEVYIIGGVIPLPPTAFPPTTTNITQAYSILNNEWITKSSLPIPLNHLNAAVVAGKIYVLGGLAPNNQSNWVAVPNCYVYDPQTDHWQTLPPMPAGQARGSAAMGVYGSRIYLGGGMAALDFAPSGLLATVSTSSFYDTETGTWTSVPDLPSPRDHAGAGLVGNTFYVLGGRLISQDNVQNTVFALDVRYPENGWTSKATMPTARGGCASATLGGMIYTFGGEGNKELASGVFNVTEAYDAVNDEWSKLTMMELPRHGTYAVGVEEKVYIPGGGIAQSGAPVTSFDAFEPFAY